MGKKGKNTAKKKAARQEAKAAEKSDRELKKNLPAKIDALLAKGQEETKGIDLFADPPPKEECAICLHPHSLEIVGEYSSWLHKSCCGKKICRGCIHASQLATDKINQRKKKNKEPLLTYTCAFCMEPEPVDTKENFNRLVKRVVLNDANSINALAGKYRNGVGTPKDEVKALDLYCRAAELGEAQGYGTIAIFYELGAVVEKNIPRAIAFAEISAKKGHILARHNVGAYENNRGKYDIATRHFKIAAEAGYQASLDALNMYLERGDEVLGEGEFDEIKRKCLASKAEMKTDQRDAWAKHFAAKIGRG